MQRVGQGRGNARAVESIRQQEGQVRGVLGQWERKGCGSAKATGV